MKRLLLLLFAAVITLGTLIYVFGFRPSAELDLKININNAKIAIGSQEIVGDRQQSLKLKPGKYVISVQADGFEPFSQTVSLGFNQKQALSVSLEPRPMLDIYLLAIGEDPDRPAVHRYEIVQPKFFQNYSWAAGYLTSEDTGEVHGVALNRKDGKWLLATYFDPNEEEELLEAKAATPSEVYNHLRP